MTQQPTFTTLPPLSLYLHIPWCVRKCPYCDFNSHEARRAIPQQKYVDAMILDLEQELPRVWGRIVQTIYIGGGTPSLFSPEEIDRLLSRIRALLPLAPDAEITLEANPGTTETGRFHGYRQAGINRLSIGIQSFNEDMLKALGRIHGREQALHAVSLANTAGLANINLDLMFGLPRQSLAEALADLRTAMSLQPTHLSVYQLTIEPNTLFYINRPQLPDDDKLWTMQSALHALLSKNNYTQYEVSAFARSGYQCRHNINYWRFGDYLGIGAGAHGKITNNTSITRSWKVKQPSEYMKTAGTPAVIGGSRSLTTQETPLEFMMNALRLTHGFPLGLFQERTGMPISLAEKPLQWSQKRGLLTLDRDNIRPTEYGKRFLNDLLVQFM